MARRTQIWRWVSFAMALALVAVVVYLGWVGFQGSSLFGEQSRGGDCRTPASAFGWDYQAVNYDIAADRALDAYADRENCPSSGEPAGAALTTDDGVPIAGWYVAAEAGRGATAPTVVLAHAEGKNKSAMLEWAETLHADYNLVFFDFRNSGQSGGSVTTMGVEEMRDLRAVLDWLESAKHPASVAVLGVSMGAAAAIDEAAADPRVAAVIADSPYATLANALQARLEKDGYPLSLPGAWSILLGGLLRTGVDTSAGDPLQTIDHYGSRPLLIVAAGSDRAVGAGDAVALRDRASEGGAAVELESCAGAAHAEAMRTCPTEYHGWLLGFLGQALNGGR